jgi:hypothetical protein
VWTGVSGAVFFCKRAPESLLTGILEQQRRESMSRARTGVMTMARPPAVRRRTREGLMDAEPYAPAGYTQADMAAPTIAVGAPMGGPMVADVAEPSIEDSGLMAVPGFMANTINGISATVTSPFHFVLKRTYNYGIAYLILPVALLYFFKPDAALLLDWSTWYDKLDKPIFALGSYLLTVAWVVLPLLGGVAMVKVARTIRTLNDEYWVHRGTCGLVHGVVALILTWFYIHTFLNRMLVEAAILALLATAHTYMAYHEFRAMGHAPEQIYKALSLWWAYTFILTVFLYKLNDKRLKEQLTT